MRCRVFGRKAFMDMITLKNVFKETTTNYEREPTLTPEQLLILMVIGLKN